MTGKGEDQQRCPPGVAASPPPAQHGSPGWRPQDLTQRELQLQLPPAWGNEHSPQEDDSHLKCTGKPFGATVDRGLWSQTDNAAPLYLSLTAPAAAAGSHQAPERQGAKEALGAKPPQAEHGMQWAHWWGMELATQLCRQQLSVSMWQVKLPSLLNTHASYHWFAQQD